MPAKEFAKNLPRVGHQALSGRILGQDRQRQEPVRVGDAARLVRRDQVADGAVQQIAVPIPYRPCWPAYIMAGGSQDQESDRPDRLTEIEPTQ